MPEDTPPTPEVLITREGVIGVIALNRPRALHALTTGMCAAMTQALLAWRDDPAVRLVLITHAQGRGFCAGGDIAMMRQSALEDGGAAAATFFLTEYRLNHLLFTYPKPVVAFMDGITMGGGVGLSLPARWRVATAATRLAMPETGIGLFPDVGGSWYLGRLPGRLGTFMALTGARLDGAECLWAGLATHYLPSEALAQARTRLAAGEPPEIVLGALAEAPPPARLGAHAATIDRLFAADTVEAILAALAQDTDPWAREQHKVLAGKSPFSCVVALRALQESARLPDFAAEMAMEYALAIRIVLHPDFAEGVRALIVEKDNAPRWHDTRPGAVPAATVEALFAPLPPAQAWAPL